MAALSAKNEYDSSKAAYELTVPLSPQMGSPIYWAFYLWAKNKMIPQKPPINWQPHWRGHLEARFFWADLGALSGRPKFLGRCAKRKRNIGLQMPLETYPVQIDIYEISLGFSSSNEAIA